MTHSVIIFNIKAVIITGDEMKRISILILSVLLMLCLASCKGSDDNETTQSVTQMPSQTTTYESDVTAVNTDEEKGESLKSDITGFFDGAGEVDGVFSNGSFTYKNTRQASVMYAYERDSALEEKARENAQSFADAVSDYYEGGLVLADFSATQIGSSDNGIDSVKYDAVYLNSQNQTLRITLDSDAVISYVDCALTW